MVRGPLWRKGSRLSRRRYSCAGRHPRGEPILALARHLLCLRSYAFAEATAPQAVLVVPPALSYGGQDFGELSRAAVLVLELG